MEKSTILSMIDGAIRIVAGQIDAISARPRDSSFDVLKYNQDGVRLTMLETLKKALSGYRKDINGGADPESIFADPDLAAQIQSMDILSGSAIRKEINKRKQKNPKPPKPGGGSGGGGGGGLNSWNYNPFGWMFGAGTKGVIGTGGAAAGETSGMTLLVTVLGGLAASSTIGIGSWLASNAQKRAEEAAQVDGISESEFNAYCGYLISWARTTARSMAKKGDGRMPAPPLRYIEWANRRAPLSGY